MGCRSGTCEASPDGRTVAAVDYEAKAGSGTPTPHGRSRSLTGLRTIAWRPDGQQFVAALWDSASVQIFDRSGNLVQTIAGDEQYEVLSVDVNGEGVVAVGEKPLGRADLARHRVTLHDAATGELIRVLPAESLAGTLAFDPSGQRLALSFLDGHVEIRDLATDARTIMAGHVGEVFDVTWSEDGARVATSGAGWHGPRLGCAHGSCRSWSSAGTGRGVGQVRFSPDGSSLASSGRDGVRIWALDIDDLIDVAHRNVTRQLSRQECLEYLHLDACPVPTS